MTLKAPPPSPDMSLIDSQEATGPPRIVCDPPDKVETCCALWKLSTTPRDNRMTVTTDNGACEVDPEAADFKDLVLGKPAR